MKTTLEDLIRNNRTHVNVYNNQGVGTGKSGFLITMHPSNVIQLKNIKNGIYTINQIKELLN